MWIKDSDEQMDYAIDWADRLGDLDTISTSTWDVEAGLTVGTGPKAPNIQGTLAVIWLSGGTPGTEYTITNTIVTAGGRTYEKETTLRVETEAIAGLPAYNGCDWPLDPACLGDKWDTYSDAVRARSTSLASATLYRLTGYRVGGCPVKVRPRPQRGFCAIPYMEGRGFPFYPLNVNGNWSNLTCPPCGDPRLVNLPAPVNNITEVKVDGAVIDPANYRVVDRHYLAWVGPGDPPWPADQDYVVPDTQPGTFSVTYLNSHPVDYLGAYAAGLLAVEFAKACSGKSCALPANVVSIVRQGVSYEMSAGAFPDGKTKIREVDAFIEQWNPKGRRPGQVIVPGRKVAVSER